MKYEFCIFGTGVTQVDAVKCQWKVSDPYSPAIVASGEIEMENKVSSISNSKFQAELSHY